MSKDFSTMENSNVSNNPSIHDLSSPERRSVMQGGIGALAMKLFAPSALLAGCVSSASKPVFKLGFKAIPISSADQVVVPEGYTATAFMPWGEPVGLAGNMPPLKHDSSSSADEQAAQMGMHHDGMQFYPLADGAAGSRHGLLVMNHEYVDHELLWPEGSSNWSLDKIRKSQAAHGLTVIEVKQTNGKWDAVRPSKYARRVTSNSPCAIGGPGAGHAMMKTNADPAAARVLGTLNNCASGMTPWGTYLSGEENFSFYFANPEDKDPHAKRWGINKTAWYRWAEHDPRFNLVTEPNEHNRFGWVVELDPFDPDSTPIKRTALGRAAHEGAWVGVTKDNRAVVYSGEDARFEYIYKFVSRDRIAPGGGKANRTLLDHGTLYVARFDADGKGRWLPLVAGQGPLNIANGFADQGEVVIKARQASDALGGTKMDRPEWMAIDQAKKTVYCTLTNNSQRGNSQRPQPDPANPRPNNIMGHIVQWTEDNDFDATTFAWKHLVLAGDPSSSKSEDKGNIKGDLFACPDGICLDEARGVLWITTDVGPTVLNKGDYKNFGNNQMLSCDLATGEVKRFMVGPAGCEVTGLCFAPDGKTAFVNIQHPGEPGSERNDPKNPTKISAWPIGHRPRSATVIITKNDGGVIGS